MTRPVKLTEEQMNAVFGASFPLPPDRRSAFLADVAQELSALPVVGDGVLHRVIMNVQKKFYDPPADPAPYMHRQGVGKYA